MKRLLFVLLFASALAAPASAEKRVALVVGNSTYKSVARLDNPNNDASLMARTLKGHDRTKFIAAHGNWRPDTSATPGVAGLSAIECARVKAVMVHGRTRPSRTIRMSGRRVQHSSAAHQKGGPDRA